MRSGLKVQNPLVLLVVAVVAGVVGLVALVVLTIVLAAVIGTFVLGLGADLGDGTIEDDDGPPGATHTPQAAFSVDEDDGNLLVAHTSGDEVPANELLIVYEDGTGEELLRSTWDEVVGVGPDDRVRPGDAVRLHVDAESGDVLRLLWTGGDGEQQLLRYTVD